MAATKDKINDDAMVAPWLRREVEAAIADLKEAVNDGNPSLVMERERALPTAKSPLAACRSREASELWQLIGKARESAHEALLEAGLIDLASRFDNGHPERGRRNGQPAKPNRALPKGKLGRLAGTPPEPWQAKAEMGRRRAIEAQATVKEILKISD